jgi:hypothetical protein
MSNDKSFNQFITLDSDDFNEPFEIIDEYCANDSLFNVRKEIFELFSIAMLSLEWQGDRPIEKANRMYHLKLMIQIIETVYLINQLRESGRLMYTIRPEEQPGT